MGQVCHVVEKVNSDHGHFQTFEISNSKIKKTKLKTETVAQWLRLLLEGLGFKPAAQTLSVECAFIPESYRPDKNVILVTLNCPKLCECTAVSLCLSCEFFHSVTSFSSSGILVWTLLLLKPHHHTSVCVYAMKNLVLSCHVLTAHTNMSIYQLEQEL